MDQLDGKKQRAALSAAQKALEAFADGDTARALSSAQKAESLDQLGVFAGLAGVFTSDYPSPAAQWNALAEMMGAGPLQALIDDLRG